MPGWYLEWIAAYLTANDANTGTNQAMLKAWWPGFVALRADPAEMRQAIYDVLALTDRPIRTADHFAAIRSAILNRRADRAKAAVKDYSAEDRGLCTECGDTGWIIVPHHKHSSAEGWRPAYSSTAKEIFVTCAVLCACSIGRRFADAQKERDESQRAMGIEAYQNFVNSNWRQQMIDRRSDREALYRTEAAIDPKAMIGQIARGVR
jgi:hypothetical protein